MSNPKWLNEEGLRTLNSGYLLTKGEELMTGEVVSKDTETVRDAYLRIVSNVGRVYPELSEVYGGLLHCLWKGWIGLSTPVMSNFGAKRGLPISCFLVHLGDSIESLYGHKLTVAQMSKNGGGTAAYFGDIRPQNSPISNGGKASCVSNWIREYDLTARVVTQGNVRRGSIASYIDIEHPDVLKVLLAKDHTMGDPRQFIDCNLGVNISDRFIKEMLNGDKEKIEIFSKVLEMRLKTGSPYIFFSDNVNRDTEMKVSMSNLCSEILLYTDPDHSAVCCLSSMNLRKWDEWKEWKDPLTNFTAPQLAVILLDSVLEEFIEKASRIKGMESAVRFSQKSRALGLGTMGLHSLYQSKLYPWDSPKARSLNIQIHKKIKEDAVKASAYLGEKYGSPLWAKPGMRNSHLMAIAPTRTNSVITGAFSQGVEPIESNYFNVKQAKVTDVRKNPNLEQYLVEYYPEEDLEVLWESILSNKGSVSHLKKIPENIREVFKTAREIDQYSIIDHAVDRQKYICQGQSINLFGDTPKNALDVWRLHLYAWKKGLKTLYYFKSKSKAVSESKYTIITKKGCKYCELLKEKLTLEGKEYTEIDLKVAKNSGLWEEEWGTVPQLFLGSLRLGGYSDYQEVEECLSCQG